MMLAWLASVAVAECPQATAPGALAASLDEAEAGYTALDVEAFTDRLDEAALTLPCLDAVIAPGLAARYHLLMGLRLFTVGREADAVGAFAAARAGDPPQELPTSLVPAGHEVRALYASAVAPGRTVVAEPDGVVLYFDGVTSASRPNHPVVMQIVTPSGAVNATQWLAPDDELLAYPVAAPLPTPAPTPESGTVAAVAPVPPSAESRRPRWALLGVAGAAATASAVLYGLGAASEARFAGPLPPEEVGRDELLALRGRTNALVIGSGIAGGVAAVGVVSFVVIR